jgi:hypothetical protein
MDKKYSAEILQNHRNCSLDKKFSYPPLVKVYFGVKLLWKCGESTQTRFYFEKDVGNLPKIKF